MKPLNVSVLLVGVDTLGGAERRIAAFMRHVSSTSDLKVILVVNSDLFYPLTHSGLSPAGRVVVLRSWYYESSFNRMIRKSPKNALYKLLKRLFKVTSTIFLSWQLGVYLLLNRPDVIHLVLGGARTITFPFLPFLKSAIVSSVVGTDVRSFDLMWPSDQHVLRLFLKMSHVVDALSEELHSLLLQKKLTEEPKIRISGSFVDTKEYHADPKKNSWVVFAARLIDEKNPLLFLDAMPKVLTEIGRGVHFFILGTGNLEQIINERVQEYGIEEFVTVGFHRYVGKVLSKSIIFCSLQEHENYPSRSLLEAMSCGNAIVATDVGYTHKLVNEFTGVRVPPSSAKVASAIIELLKNTNKTLEMGQRARQMVMDNYSPEAYCGKMREIYWEAYNINGFRIKPPK
jgi:glycosyltransferase involved in cell wall biosynthesis